MVITELLDTNSETVVELPFVQASCPWRISLHCEQFRPTALLTYVMQASLPVCPGFQGY